MKAEELLREIHKSKRFLPANLEEVEVLLSNNTFYFIKEEQILHKFTIKED